MKQYKFKLIRMSVLNGAAQQLEEIANKYSREGWDFKSAQYFNDILSFLLVFEKSD